MITQVSQGDLNKNRNLMWTRRGKACLILIFSTNTNCESMAYRSSRSEEYSARGVRKVTTGITVYQVTTLSKVPFSLLEAIPPISQQPLRDITGLWQLSRSYRHSLLFDPSMSAGSAAHWVQLTLQLEVQRRIQLTLHGGSGAQDTKCRLWPRRLWHRELLRLKTRVMTSEVVATRV